MGGVKILYTNKTHVLIRCTLFSFTLKKCAELTLDAHLLAFFDSVFEKVLTNQNKFDTISLMNVLKLVLVYCFYRKVCEMGKGQGGNPIDELWSRLAKQEKTARVRELLAMFSIIDELVLKEGLPNRSLTEEYISRRKSIGRKNMYRGCEVQPLEVYLANEAEFLLDPFNEARIFPEGETEYGDANWLAVSKERLAAIKLALNNRKIVNNLATQLEAASAMKEAEPKGIWAIVLRDFANLKNNDPARKKAEEAVVSFVAEVPQDIYGFSKPPHKSGDTYFQSDDSSLGVQVTRPGRVINTGGATYIGGNVTNNGGITHYGGTLGNVTYNDNRPKSSIKLEDNLTLLDVYDNHRVSDLFALLDNANGLKTQISKAIAVAGILQARQYEIDMEHLEKQITKYTNELRAIAAKYNLVFN
jgi:hypothetical protein